MSAAQPASETARCGQALFVGRPNVGKSTLFNRILGAEYSAVSPKPQTTRGLLRGIKTAAGAQMICLDAPGHERRAFSTAMRRINRAARASFGEAVDVAVFVAEADDWREADAELLRSLTEALDCPRLLALNKIDRLSDADQQLPMLEKLSALEAFDELIPLSARRGVGVDRLEACLRRYLPERPHRFPADRRIDAERSFLIAERVREKIMRRTSGELPYITEVEVERLRRAGGGLLDASLRLSVAREGQKKILVGRDGRMLKSIGSAARRDLEALLGVKLMLRLHVRVDGER